jgi:hypothetical protein
MITPSPGPVKESRFADSASAPDREMSVRPARMIVPPRLTVA